MQDGGKIQNGAQNTKKLNFAVKWPIFNGFQKTFVRFVCRTVIYKYPLSLLKKNPRWRRKSI
jgi:hypothetical protein